MWLRNYSNIDMLSYWLLCRLIMVRHTELMAYYCQRKSEWMQLSVGVDALVRLRRCRSDSFRLGPSLFWSVIGSVFVTDDRSLPKAATQPPFFPPHKSPHDTRVPIASVSTVNGRIPKADLYQYRLNRSKLPARLIPSAFSQQLHDKIHQTTAK